MPQPPSRAQAPARLSPTKGVKTSMVPLTNRAQALAPACHSPTNGREVPHRSEVSHRSHRSKGPHHSKVPHRSIALNPAEAQTGPRATNRVEVIRPGPAATTAMDIAEVLSRPAFLTQLHRRLCRVHLVVLQEPQTRG